MKESFHTYRRRLRRWIQSQRVPRLLTVNFYWAILTWPLRTIWSGWQQGRVRNLLLGIPALIAVMAVGWFLASSRLQARDISARYWVRAQAAMSDKDYEQALLLLQRVLQEDKGHQQDAMHALAILFEEVGQKDRAASMFRVLAPEGRQGYSSAHRRLAILTSASITTQSSPEELKAFHWHLQAAHDDSSPGMALAWGRYCLAIQDLAEARRYFRVAVAQHPELLTTLGQVEAFLGNQEAAISTYQQAADYLAKELRGNPADHLKRVDYAQTLMRLGQFDKAKIVLEQGLKSNPDQEATWEWLLASLYVNYHDLMSAEGRPISDLLSQLDLALKMDPNHGMALSRLMAYAEANVEGNVELRTILARVIAEGQQPALAHLAMGNLCWIEDRKEQAMFHFEQAMQIRDDVPVMLNNLAFLIADEKNNEDPDLDRAMALVNAALEKQPDNGSFLDTRGTIYVKQKNWRAALTDLEKALKNVKDKKLVHEKLALVYQKLELPEIAEQHRLLSVKVLNSTQ